MADIFNVQISFLENSSFLKKIKDLVYDRKANIEYVLAREIRLIEEKFGSLEDDIIKERFFDIEDVYHRILRNLLDIEHVRVNPLKRVETPVIFAAKKLLPSDVALLDFDKILALIIEEGSKVSHVAIIARSLDIPAIINIPEVSVLLRNRDFLIVDALTGKLIIHPAGHEVKEYGEIQKRLLGERAKRKVAGNIPPCRTRDGITISLKANVGSLKETEEAMLFGADGIGLLRSELFYLARSEMPSIKEEFEFYKKILQKMPDRTVTIRLLDLGADKNPPYLEEYKESNPQLGCRGIRYLLRNAELFQRHLLSILRASAIAPVHILVPFVATVDDLDRTLMIIDDICQKEVINKKNIQVGIMVEIPSVALSMESWLEKVDFINIGTNDLVQYMFAASREDGGLKDYQQVVHPVMLRIIKNIVFSASNQRKKVTICGEAASDPVWALLLIGLGVRSLSMQPSSIPLVRDRIIEAEYEELKEVARQAMEAHTINEVYAITRQLMEHKGR